MSRNATESLKQIEPAVLLVAMVYPTLHALLYFCGLNGTAIGVRQEVYLGGKLAQLAIPAAWLLAVRPTRPTWKRPGAVEMMQAAALSIVLGGALLGLYHGWFKASRYELLVGRVLQSRMAGFGVHNFSEFLVNRSLHTVLHSLLEEFYWRWFVFGRLRHLTSVQNAVFVSSLAFTGHHVVILSCYVGPSSVLTWVFLSAVVAAGAFWAYIYHRKGSLFVPWMTHLAVNGTLAWIAYDMIAKFASTV